MGATTNQPTLSHNYGLIKCNFNLGEESEIAHDGDDGEEKADGEEVDCNQTISDDENQVKEVSNTSPIGGNVISIPIP